MRDLINRALGVIALCCFSPIMLGITASIYVIDGAPILFRQVRLGKNRAPFEALKFRTMERGVVTRSGRWLRATGLDELAQLLNIARGDMYVVGPRPITEADRVRFGYIQREHDLRWGVKPGLTGISQIWGGYDVEQSWELDKKYLEKKSFLLDVQLVAITLLMNISGKKRVRKHLIRGTYE